MPERLSLASEGWQVWQEIRTSSLGPPGQEPFAVGQVSRLERRVDADLVLVLRSARRAAAVLRQKPQSSL